MLGQIVTTCRTRIQVDDWGARNGNIRLLKKLPERCAELMTTLMRSLAVGCEKSQPTQELQSQRMVKLLQGRQKRNVHP